MGAAAERAFYLADRLAYRVSEVARLAGVSRAAVLRQCEPGGPIKVKRVNGLVLLCPEDVEKVFGFRDETDRIAPDAKSLAIAEELLA